MDLESRTMRLGSAMLARLQYSSQTVGTVNNINPTPISWDNIEEASETDSTITSLQVILACRTPGILQVL